MTPVLAISTGAAILAFVGLAVGVVVLGVVVALFMRIMRPAGEIDAYTRNILEHGVAIARNVDGVDELDRTRDLGAAVPGLATTYLEKLGGRP